ncbi:MAG: hypothetical protein EXR72_17295 [Myxococcales bacterium]|nr:hypothetical protein [Myxococcales bacterium]
MPTTAHADRYGRGLLRFQEARCASCHTVGWRDPVPAERPRLVDLTRSARHRTDEDLRRWMAAPEERKPATACRHRALSAEEIDDLLFFLHARTALQPTTPRPPRNLARPMGRGDTSHQSVRR